MLKKIILFISFLISFISFSIINMDKVDSELKSIKKKLITKYKKEYGTDFSNLENNSIKEIRIFKETLYLSFLSKYVKDISDVKIYSNEEFNNILIFADEIIEKDEFCKIFDILFRDDNKKLKLIHVPTNRSKVYGEIIQEKSSERE